MTHSLLLNTKKQSIWHAKRYVSRSISSFHRYPQNLTKPMKLTSVRTWTRWNERLEKRRSSVSANKKPRWVIGIARRRRAKHQFGSSRKWRSVQVASKPSRNDRRIVREAEFHLRTVRKILKRVLSDVDETRIGFIERDLARWHGVRLEYNICIFEGKNTFDSRFSTHGLVIAAYVYRLLNQLALFSDHFVLLTFRRTFILHNGVPFSNDRLLNINSCFSRDFFISSLDYRERLYIIGGE